MERIYMNDMQEVIYRLRKGESVEAIYRDTGHARKTIRKYRDFAEKHGFLKERRGIPDVAELASLLGPVRHLNQREISALGWWRSIEAHRHSLMKFGFS